MGCTSPRTSTDVPSAKMLNPSLHPSSLSRKNLYSNGVGVNRRESRQKVNKVQFVNPFNEAESCENVQLSTSEMTIDDQKMLDAVLSKHFLFHKLSSEERKEVIKQFANYNLGSRQERDEHQDQILLFRKGEEAKMFFVIKSGSVEILPEDSESKESTVELPGSKAFCSESKAITLVRGDSFGELALLYRCRRNASALCRINSKTTNSFLCLSSQTFKQTLQSLAERNIEAHKIILQRVKLFQFLSEKQKHKLAAQAITLKYLNYEQIFKEGDEATAFYVIVMGKVRIDIKDKDSLVLKPGDYFGESCFKSISNEVEEIKRAGTATCHTEKVQLLCINKACIKKVLANESQELCYFSILKWSFKRTPLLQELSNQAVEKLIRQSDIIKFKHNHMICDNGVRVKKIYIPLQGHINQFSVGQVINFEYLQQIAKQGTKNSKLTIVKTFRNVNGNNNFDLDYIQSDTQLFKHGDGGVCVIDIEKLLTVLRKNGVDIENRDWSKVMEKLAIERCGYDEFKQLQNQYIGSTSRMMPKSIKFIDSSDIKLENLTVLELLGEGQYGKVYKVVYHSQLFDQGSVGKNSPSIKAINSKMKLTTKSSFKTLSKIPAVIETFSLKVVEKKTIEESQMTRFVFQEKQLLKQLCSASLSKNESCPFIMQYIKSFHTPQYVMFLLEYIPGVDFFELMQQIGWLTEEMNRFFFASFVLALEFLHGRDVIFRDLKPENAVLDQRGYLKIVDLGTARRLGRQSELKVKGKNSILKQPTTYRTYTIVGTPHYMAPEVIEGRGYSFEADIWSLGVILFEMACGTFPFGENLQDPLQIYEQVCKPFVKLQYPPQMKDQNTKRLIERLIVRNQSIRDIQSFSQIKDSQFYAGFDWKLFQQRGMKSPVLEKEYCQREELAEKFINVSAEELFKSVPGKENIGHENNDIWLKF